jgi:hypothetical protein
MADVRFVAIEQFRRIFPLETQALAGRMTAQKGRYRRDSKPPVFIATFDCESRYNPRPHTFVYGLTALASLWPRDECLWRQVTQRIGLFTVLIRTEILQQQCVVWMQLAGG